MADKWYVAHFKIQRIHATQHNFSLLQPYFPTFYDRVCWFCSFLKNSCSIDQLLSLVLPTLSNLLSMIGFSDFLNFSDNISQSSTEGLVFMLAHKIEHGRSHLPIPNSGCPEKDSMECLRQKQSTMASVLLESPKPTTCDTQILVLDQHTIVGPIQCLYWYLIVQKNENRNSWLMFKSTLLQNN